MKIIVTNIASAIAVLATAALSLCCSESFQLKSTTCGRLSYPFPFPQVQERRQQLAGRVSTTTLFQAKKQRQQEEPQFPSNEFSRTISPERILKTRGGANSYSRDYTLNIEATEDECAGLAKRFSLSNIGKLQASLALRREPLPSGRGGGTTRSSTSQSGVQVEGTVHATVTQTCVRTNEQFQVQLEFPLNCRVRPVAPLWLGGGDDVFSNMEEEPSNKKKRNAAAKEDRRNSNFQQIDIMELQRMLEDVDDEDEDDVLMEDQSIYTINGMLDVGELVAQLCWLQLDPYPKKPGTNPVQRSITG